MLRGSCLEKKHIRPWLRCYVAAGLSLSNTSNEIESQIQVS